MSNCGFTCGACGEFNPPQLVPPPVGNTVLVTDIQQPHRLSSNRETDAVTAMKRGLKEYLEQVFVDVDGVRVRFQQVYDVWAETETHATFPSAAVLVTSDTTLDYSSFTPNIDVKNKLPDGKYLVKYCEAAATFSIEYHCTTPDERVAISMMLEDALNPVNWMYGFKLDLPHYYNQRAVFEPTMTRMDDSADAAIRHFRVGTATVTGHISVLRPMKLPGLEPKIRLTVEQG